MVKQLTREESLSKASKSLMLKEAFYGLFLIMLNKTWRKDIPTLCVGKNGINYQLLINEDFWFNTLVDDEKTGCNTRRGALKHELLHIAMMHLLVHEDFHDKDVFNIAADIEINQYIDPKDVGVGWMLPSTFPELKLELKKGTRYYYEKLIEAKNASQSKALAGCLKAMGENDPTPGKPQYGPGGELLPDHSGWAEFEGLSEAEKKLVQGQADYQLKEVAEQTLRSRGTIPSELKAYIDALNFREPPKFDWRTFVRRFAGGSTKIYTKKLRRKFNKRFEENPGLKIKPRRHILVAVDTSGSVSDEELKEFFHEIYHIDRTGTQVTVVQADAAISNISPYKKSMEIAIHGRGGTSFQPVVDYYLDNLRKYTCLIYLTDGEAPIPESRGMARMLWVLSSSSKKTEGFPGVTIQLN